MKTAFATLFFALTSAMCHSQNGDFHLDKEYPMSTDGVIKLTSSDAKVFITGSDRKSAHVRIDRKVTVKGLNYSEQEFRVDIDNEDGNLTIKEYSRGSTAGIITYYKEEYRIEIAAPEGASLTIRGDDGDYFIKNVNGAISMDIDDADAELTACKGSQFSFSIDDGDIRMDGGKGSLDVDGDDADINILNGKFSSIHADMDDGDIIIETSLSDSGEYEFDSQDGLIALTITGGGGEFDVRHDDGSVSAGSGFKTTYEGEERTRLVLDAGKAKLRFRVDDARVKLATR